MTDRVVLVTGGTSGIGEGIAQRFAEGGDSVMIHGLDDDNSPAAQRRLSRHGNKVVRSTGDLSHSDVPAELVSATVEAFGRIDVVINNAGMNVFTGVVDSTLSDWDRAMNLNLRAAWLVSQAAVPHMRPGSSITTISSNHAYTTMPGCFPYNVAKAGLLGLTTALAVELAPLGIRANTICPGWTDTPAVRRELAQGPADARERIESLHLTGRIGTPADVAEAAWYLAGAGQVTGTQLTIDGGRAAQMEDPIP